MQLRNLSVSESVKPRRTFIKLLGGGIVLSALPALSGCSGAIPSAAIEAWNTAAPKDDVRRFMLSHGLLAPNPHNRQPWIADLSRNNEITLLCDKDRLLPETDPFGRQILIGCGAFIELAVIAAAELGYRVEVQPFPNGAPDLKTLPAGVAVARLILVKDASAQPDPLFTQIRRRHTNKSLYDSTKSISPEQWQALVSPAQAFGLIGSAVNERANIEQVRSITRRSFEIEMLTPRTYLESAHLMRIGPSEISQHRDGISMPSPMVNALATFGLFNRFEIPTTGSSNYGRIMERWLPFETGSGYLWIAAPAQSRPAQLSAGRAYVRSHLAATALGIDMHPLSQALQEFVEVGAQFSALHQMLGLDPNTNTLQMLSRVGFGATPGVASPRRPIAEMIRA
jgi:hypothetical protein